MVGASAARGRGAGSGIRLFGVVARSRSPRRSRRARGRRRRRSSAVVCRGRPSAANADRAVADSARRARPRLRLGPRWRRSSQPTFGRRRACQADSTSSLRTCALPTLVIDPCRRFSPEEVLRGHQADKGHELLCALEAVEVADLGDEQRERGERVDPGAGNAPRERAPATAPARPSSAIARSSASIWSRRFHEIDRVQVDMNVDLLGGVLEPLLGQPLAPNHTPGQAGQQAPWRRQNFDSRCRSRIRSRRASSRARTRSRAASSSGEGTWIGASSPPASRRASLRASRRIGLDPITGRLRRPAPAPPPRTRSRAERSTDRDRSRSDPPHSSSAPTASGRSSRARPPPRHRAASAPPATHRRGPPPAGSNERERSSPTATVVVESYMVGDLRMWLYRATPATHDRCVGADHSPPATGHHSPRGYGSILSNPRSCTT